VPFDLGHFVDRFFQPFNTESRFYWPAVYAVAISLVANVVWYNWRRRGPTAPAENALKSWVFWTNVVFLIVVMVWIIAKLPFFIIGITIAVNIAIIGFNDTPLAAELPVPPTTVRSPMHEMGYRGLNLLVRLMQGEEVESERLAPDFMVRASTTGIASLPLSRVLGRHAT